MAGFVAAAALALPVSLAELKADGRIATSEEDALLAGLARAATDLCESFTGSLLIAREVSETVAAGTAWTRLGAAPVRSIGPVAAIGLDGAEALLPADGYAVDIDAAGDGWVRLTAARTERRLQVSYVAGLAGDANGVPEALRLGIARLAIHYFASRDTEKPGSPPAAVTALWRPWRRLRLGQNPR
ncbi:head-tail connector protein [Sphingosinicella sp.]|uniref:head-tail connector protein n=1 Tax=Sphingosinicella sp. TaxID=1917971 RepID=UPI004037E989